MKKQLLTAAILCCFVIAGSTAAPKSAKKKPKIPVSRVQTHMDGYLGDRIDACIRVRVCSEDPDLLVAPMRRQTETSLWQSEFWGKWTLGAIASYRYNKDPELLRKIEGGVESLLAAQQPDGYIGNYAPEAQLTNWDVWGRKYTMLGLLAYYDLTGDKTYYDRALGIADTYVRLQREDGSLPIKVDFVTGEPVNDACAMLHPLLRYFQRLKADYGVETYAEAQAEGERWMRDVAIRNFDMTGQFEDVTVLGLQPYENLTNCTAAPYAAYLLSKEAPSAEDMADAVDLARFSEDQFTFWDTPLTENGIKDKATPCVYEQYKYQKPVDNSACNVADAMLSLYEATGEEIYLAKGKALIDNITVVQNAVNGQIPTTWDFRPTKSDRNRTYWINCSYSSISSLLRLEKLLAERQK